MQSVEDIKEYPLMEQVQHPCGKDCKIEDNEIEFPLYEEDDYPSLCVVEDTDFLKDEDIDDELTTILSLEIQVTIDYIS